MWNHPPENHPPLVFDTCFCLFSIILRFSPCAYAYEFVCNKLMNPHASGLQSDCRCRDTPGPQVLACALHTSLLLTTSNICSLSHVNFTSKPRYDHVPYSNVRLVYEPVHSRQLRYNYNDYPLLRGWSYLSHTILIIILTLRSRTLLFQLFLIKILLFAESLSNTRMRDIVDMKAP